MEPLVNGLHHITALAGNPQQNLDFYTGILGLRLVKKTINFDAPDTYHFYYGNEAGSPGTILTFFPFAGIQQGRKGPGQMRTTAFSISENSIPYWIERLKKYQIKVSEPVVKFGNTCLSLEDNDGLEIDLVANNGDDRPGFTYGNIPVDHSIKGIHSVLLSESASEKTAEMLSFILNYEPVKEENGIFRFGVPGKNLEFVDIKIEGGPKRGSSGYGTVHHLAFSTESDQTQLLLKNKVELAGISVSPVMDRDYFNSIYFREPGGILFEIATVPPGFTIDEPAETLGQQLQIPAWMESKRASIIKGLSPVMLNLKNYE